MAELADPDASSTIKLSAQEGDGKWLEHLSSLYQIEFSLIAAAAAIGTVAAPLVVGFMVNLPIPCTEPGQASCTTDLQLLAIPLVPLLIVMSLGYVFIIARVIGKYTRNIERSVSKDVLTPGESLRAPALSRLNGALFGGESYRLLPLRIFYVVLAGTILGTIGVTVAVILSRVVDTQWRVIGYLMYGTLALTCLVIYNHAATHSNFESLISAAQDRDRRKSSLDLVEHVSWLRFGWLCLLPRPLSVMKEMHAFIIAVVIVKLTQPSIDISWVRFVGGLLLFELLLYQTRYLLNAVREDPGVAWTLPSNRRNDPTISYTALQIITGVLVSVLRIVLFFLVMTRLDFLDAVTITWVIAFFTVSFYAYEYPREMCRGRLGELMGLLSPAGLERLQQPPFWSLWDSARRYGWFSFASIGSGYALRAIVGLLLASGSSRPPNLWVVFLFAWALGTASTSGGWRRELSGALGDGGTIHPGVLAKPHVVWVASLVAPPDRRYTSFRIIDEGSTQEKKELALFTLPGHRRSPWRIAYAIALISLGALEGPSGSISLALLLLMFLAGALFLFAPAPIGPAASITASWPFLLLPPMLAIALSRFSASELTPAIQAAVLTGWLLFTIRLEEASGNLLAAILGPKTFEDWLKQGFALVGKGLYFLVRVLLGAEFAKATLRVFGRT